MRSRKVIVLVLSKLTKRQLEEVSSVSSRLDVEAFENESEASRFIARSEVIAGWISVGALRKASRLKWLHSFSTGVDHLLFRGSMRKGVLLTCSKGAHSTPVAEHALMFMLMLAKRMPFYGRCQQQRKWEWMRFRAHREGVGAPGEVPGHAGRGH
ncbi:MAG: hypothetical protein JTT11_09615 [Candidatus Brockarchaeota archaeon]|nr:hypothetical protein [Candidatus Brockarchaeota archaeon]